MFYVLRAGWLMREAFIALLDNDNDTYFNENRAVRISHN